MPPEEIQEVIFGYGHENILATHRATLEFTKDPHLSKRGDCIITVATDKALADLTAEFKEKLRKPHAKLTITIGADGIIERVNAEGSPQLVLTHPREIVIRKSYYVCSRTLAVKADKSACDLSRELVERLKNPEQEVKITLAVQL